LSSRPPTALPSKALPAADAAAMTQYAGQQMANGAQAETYANHFIAVHLKEIGGGKTYSQLSAEALTQPNNATLQAQVDTVFKGTTLRGLLLNAILPGIRASKIPRAIHGSNQVRLGSISAHRVTVSDTPR
jgi:hypothetical protein